MDIVVDADVHAAAKTPGLILLVSVLDVWNYYGLPLVSSCLHNLLLQNYAFLLQPLQGTSLYEMKKALTLPEWSKNSKGGSIQ